MDSTCFRLHQLEAITNNFSEDQIVGRGGRGDVYKAVLNGEEIAVKRLHSMQGLDDKDFRNELRKLNKIRHKNIIRLIGYCHDTHKKCMEYEGELVLASIQERLLCFEYMQGGSLEKHIGDESSVLDWTTCYKIIQGTCEGLNHLHNGQEKPIFHLDLKPSHILLDNNMTPKITYFGLATCVASTEEEYQTETMRGTFGYMPPEYIDKCIVSNKFDVFSLGSTIIAVMAGNMGYRRYVQVSPSPTKFIELVSENWKGRMHTTSEYPSQDIDILRVRTCITIALRCVDVDRKRRPCIEHIVRELEELEADIKRITSQPPDESKDSILQLFMQMGSNPYHLQLQHLKDITDNFSDARRLGSGGFGVVYKGVLRNGNMVAVKKLVLSTLKSQKQFENEGDLLMTLNHPNIVRLLGYCYETELIYRPYEDKFVFAQDTKHLLCLEYMPNGSLDNYISGMSSVLDWHTCCKIIEGISFGLMYLHEGSNVPIIHLDLKPANILLDENFVPKITDFGLSRLCDEKTMQTKVASGTLGYMAPEYLLRGVITPMADIFGLGVIIMEVITGHREYPYPHDIRRSSKDFIKREVQIWRNRLEKDPGYTSLEADCQQIKTCIQIGLICVNSERTKRPTVKKIIDMLQGLESMDWYIINEGTAQQSS
ncbi:unnamed protein product [Triticum aestivum]|uniref:Protein kinase domain-containing protein n=3 Tax=Triticinae TaxID=1648030 RepID=A0A7H4LAK7_WHEAT|nr:unnamed protein product [Triticum aestivum]